MILSIILRNVVPQNCLRNSQVSFFSTCSSSWFISSGKIIQKPWHKTPREIISFVCFLYSVFECEISAILDYCWISFQFKFAAAERRLFLNKIRQKRMFFKQKSFWYERNRSNFVEKILQCFTLWLIISNSGWLSPFNSSSE